MKRASSFKFNISEFYMRAQKLPKPKVSDVNINLPFLRFKVRVSNNDKKIAKEVLIRLRDKRVLVAWECCDDCIKNALASIQEIRSLLVQKQVEIADEKSPLFQIFDLMLIGIRQFLTYSEELAKRNKHVKKEELFGTLDILRGHLLRCIQEITKIGKVSPQLTNRLEFNKIWSTEIYLLQNSTQQY